jgi:hypothetical protein
VDRSMEKVLGRLSKAARKNRSGLRAEEVAVVALLRYLQSREPGKRKAA